MGIVVPIQKHPEFPPRLDPEAPIHIYIEREAPLQHHKNTDNDNNDICVTIHITTFGSHKYQSLWSFTQKIMEYQWVCCPLSSTPTSSTRLFFFGARLLRPRGRPELGAGGATSSLEPAAS